MERLRSFARVSCPTRIISDSALCTQPRGSRCSTISMIALKAKSPAHRSYQALTAAFARCDEQLAEVARERELRG